MDAGSYRIPDVPFFFLQPLVSPEGAGGLLKKINKEYNKKKKFRLRLRVGVSRAPQGDAPLRQCCHAGVRPMHFSVEIYL